LYAFSPAKAKPSFKKPSFALVSAFAIQYGTFLKSHVFKHFQEHFIGFFPPFSTSSVNYHDL
jgi:hypothetical protein